MALRDAIEGTRPHLSAASVIHATKRGRSVHDVFHHFLNNAHEVLGVASGSAWVQSGVHDGPVVEVTAGDAVPLTASTRHKRNEASSNLLVVGAYLEGQTDYNTPRGEAAERRIAEIPVPQRDPLLGQAPPRNE